MKKMSKLVMAAILAVALQGTAMATVDLEATPSGAYSFANELITENTTVINDTNLAGSIDVTGKLGFGVSNTQTRYIRLDLTGVKFSTALTPASLTIANATVALASQGPGFVIFQITASADLPVAHPFTVTIDNLLVTNKNQASTVAYSLYEQAGYAVNQNADGLLYTKSNTIATFAPGLNISIVAANTNTADVTELYKKFKTSSTATQTVAEIGTINYGVVTGVKNTTSGPVILADLVQSPSSLVVTTNKTLGSASGLYLAANDYCGTSDIAANLPLGTTTAVIPVGTTEKLNKAICYTATGTTPVDVQNFTLSSNLTAATNAATVNVGPLALGDFDHDGTVLRAPFIQGFKGQRPFVQLANMSGLSASYEVTCFGPNNVTRAGTPGTVAAGKTKQIALSQAGCPSDTNALEFILNVPNGSVVGSFVRQSTTTGDSAADSLTGNSNGQSSSLD